MTRLFANLPNKTKNAISADIDEFLKLKGQKLVKVIFNIQNKDKENLVSFNDEGRECVTLKGRDGKEHKYQLVSMREFVGADQHNR